MMMGGRPAFPSITNHFTQRDKKLFTMIKTETEGGERELQSFLCIPWYGPIPWEIYFFKNKRKLIIQRTDRPFKSDFFASVHVMHSDHFHHQKYLCILTSWAYFSFKTSHISNWKFASMIPSLFFATSFELLQYWLISDKKCWNMTWLGTRKLVRHFVWDFLCWPGQVSFFSH